MVRAALHGLAHNKAGWHMHARGMPLGCRVSDLQPHALDACMCACDSRACRFYYGVSGHSQGDTIAMTIMNLNKQGRLYGQDYRPWYWHAGLPDWRPLM